MLDDFSEPLDRFLVRIEASQEISLGEEDGDGTVEEGADSCSLFLEGLELYCLLKQRLFNLQHYWRHIVYNALPPCCYKGTSSCMTFVEVGSGMCVLVFK